MSASKLVPSLFLVAAGLGMVACVDDGDSTIVILQNQVPEEACAVAGAPTESFLSAGTIDVNSNFGYVFTPVVKNYAVAAEGQERLRIAFVEGARVEINFLGDPDFFNAATLAELRAEGLTRFSVPMSGPINPDATTSFKFEIVPRELLERLAPELALGESTLLQVAVRLYGTLSSGGFESQVFRYPVDVCNGCLNNVLGPCNQIDADFEPVNTGGVCNPSQDALVDCCSTDTGVVCPAVGTMPPPA